MRVEDRRDVAVRIGDLSVHLSESVRGEVLWIEFEVLISIRQSILISPLYIHDKHVEREISRREQRIALHHPIG